MQCGLRCVFSGVDKITVRILYIPPGYSIPFFRFLNRAGVLHQTVVHGLEQSCSLVRQWHSAILI